MATRAVNINNYVFNNEEDIRAILEDNHISNQVAVKEARCYTPTIFAALAKIECIGDLLVAAHSTGEQFNCSKNIYLIIIACQSLLDNAALINTTCIQAVLKALKVYQKAIGFADANQLDDSMRLIDTCIPMARSIKKIVERLEKQTEEISAKAGEALVQAVQDDLDTAEPMRDLLEKTIESFEGLTVNSGDQIEEISAKLVASRFVMARVQAVQDEFNTVQPMRKDLIEKTIKSLGLLTVSVHALRSFWRGIQNNCDALVDKDALEVYHKILKDPLEFTNELADLPKLALLLEKANLNAQAVFNRVRTTLNTTIPAAGTTHTDDESLEQIRQFIRADVGYQSNRNSNCNN